MDTGMHLRRTGANRGAGNPGAADSPVAVASAIYDRSAPSAIALLSDLDPSGNLAVALPVGLLVGQQRVVRGWLDVATRRSRSRRDGVFTGSGRGPIKRPEGPGEFGAVIGTQRGRLPVAVVDLHLHAGNR